MAHAKVIFIRQNPPFNMDYINSTHFLDHIKTKKIINNPTSIRNVSEKFYSTKFLRYMPETIFTKNIKQIGSFLRKNKKIVVKPIHGYAGKNIIYINKTLNQGILKKYIKKFDHVMVQKYLTSSRQMTLHHHYYDIYEINVVLVSTNAHVCSIIYFYKTN